MIEIRMGGRQGQVIRICFRFSMMDLVSSSFVQIKHGRCGVIKEMITDLCMLVIIISNWLKIVTGNPIVFVI